MAWYILTLLCALFLTFCVNISDSCTCLPAHPQEMFCRADFVILARIKQQTVLDEWTKIYKMRIRKAYKMSEKAEVALKFGRLQTANFSSACGVDLTPGKMYVLSGGVQHLKAKINLCHIAYLWSSLSKRQRKGFKMMYRHGCACMTPICSNCTGNKNNCQIPLEQKHCYEKEGICLPSPSNVCRWSKSATLTKCLRKNPIL